MKLLSYLVILIHFFTISKCRNTLLIVADDYGLEAGCLGNSVIRTPNIDKLAQKSVIYQQDSQFCTLFFSSPQTDPVFQNQIVQWVQIDWAYISIPGTKEIQIILSLFLIHHLLLQTKSVSSQPASKVGGLVIH